MIDLTVENTNIDSEKKFHGTLPVVHVLINIKDTYEWPIYDRLNRLNVPPFDMSRPFSCKVLSLVR